MTVERVKCVSGCELVEVVCFCVDRLCVIETEGHYMLGERLKLGDESSAL